MRRRKRSKPKAEPRAPVEAVCVEEFRTAPVGVLIPKWQRRPLHDPIVQSFPQFFMALAPVEEVNEDAR
jgi:hypothetical protein